MAVIYEKGIVVLPKEICRAGGFKVGQKIRYQAEPGEIRIRPEQDALEEFRRLRSEAPPRTEEEVEKTLAKIEKERRERRRHVP